MTPQEASEIIAKFMGYKKLDPPTRANRFDIRWVKGKKRMSSLDFHRSLDALVPVWEKLIQNKDNKYLQLRRQGEMFLCGIEDQYPNDFDWTMSENAQEAAAIATAKAIQEMG